MKRFVSVVLTLFLFTCLCFAADGAAAGAAAQDAAGTGGQENEYGKTEPMTLSYDMLEKIVPEYNQTILANDLTLLNLEDNQTLAQARSALSDSVWQLNQLADAALQASGTASDPETGQSLYNDGMLFRNTALSMQAQMAQMQVPKETIKQTKIQLNQAERQIIYGAQSLFVTYHTLGRQLADMNETVAQLDRTVKTMKVRLDLGQISELVYAQLLNQKSQIENGIATLKNERVSLVGELNLLIGRAYDAPLTIEPLPQASENFLTSIDRAKDLEAVRKANYALQLEQANVDSIVKLYYQNDTERRAGEAAQKKYEAVSARLDFTYDKYYRAISDKTAVLGLQRENLALSKKQLDVAELKFSLGQIPQAELLDAKTGYAKQQLLVDGANAALFDAIEKYKCLLAGLAAQ